MQETVSMGDRRNEKSKRTVRSPKISSIRNHNSPKLEDKGKRQGSQSPGDEVTWLTLQLEGELTEWRHLQLKMLSEAKQEE